MWQFYNEDGRTVERDRAYGCDLDDLKRWVFREDRNERGVSDWRTLIGRLFQERGLCWANLRRPKVLVL